MLEWRRYRTTAGTANFQRWSICLSAHVLDDLEKLERTLKHEYAHLLAFARFGARRGRGHGPAWRACMHELGEPPEVYHRYEVQRNQARQEVHYRCVQCGVTIVRRRQLPKRKKYSHRGCGGAIECIGIRTITSNQPST